MALCVALERKLEPVLQLLKNNDPRSRHISEEFITLKVALYVDCFP